MEDIKEAEVDSVNDLTSFLDAELAYYDSCREILLQLKREWPATSGKDNRNGGRAGRARSNTAHSYTDRFNPVEEEDAPAPKITIPRLGSSRGDSPRRDLPDSRPTFSRTITSDSVLSKRDYSPVGMNKLSRVPTEPTALLAANRGGLRPAGHRDQYEQDDRHFSGRSDSPTSYTSTPSRTASWSTLDTNDGKKKAPPPPPSRAKKPPPPPPMKRSALSTSELPNTQY